MDCKILITGGAGYMQVPTQLLSLPIWLMLTRQLSGGTLINTLLTEQHGILAQNVIAVVRSDKQALELSALGIDAVHVDLGDTDAITRLILEKDIDLVVHCASATDASLAKPLLLGLGKRIQQTGKAAYFIHTSGASAFADLTGWTHGKISDTDQVHALVKQISTPYVVRGTDNTIFDLSCEKNVTNFIVVPPLILYIQASIANKAVYKFSKDSEWQAIHVADLARFYARIIHCIVHGNAPVGGADGYFFASAHKIPWWDLLHHLAGRLHAKGLISTADVNVWPNENLAVESFGMSLEFVKIGWNSNSITLCQKGELIGWKPSWNYAMLLEHMDDEIEKVQEAGSSAKMLTLPTKLR
ncbi:unnamed protein product [Clonostachys rosea]|uniref:NAD-dependent epimerase/dehydratase domain-containing protein n=1 Tax=Bionectria ochroleuca TaxID=29856 RepID=A0ABY6TXC7_BIOOC|nr:unnamed protein product [Clonostachys rosea]